jgi:hypothetical protein
VSTAGIIAGDLNQTDAQSLTVQSDQMWFLGPTGQLTQSTTGYQTNGIADGGGGTDWNAITSVPDLNSAPDGWPQVDTTTTWPGDGGTGGGEPVVLDLTGGGINITQLSSSSQYQDMTGDGYQNRTAWAGAGNGVLVFDPSGDGKIDSPKDFEFTLWDPTATSDMQALEDVFDTNHDGSLDSGDADWNDFGVLVTNANGTTTFETLSQLGITSINLTTNNTDIVLADGSKITGETTYTKSDGTTGTVADASFAYDSNGYATQQTTTTNSDGSTTIDVKAFNPDGSLANETVRTTSADGLSITLQFDDTGNGLFDRTQTDDTVNNADGSKTVTISNYDVTGALTSSTVTTTSADGKTVTIDRDLTGGGTVDQTETHVTNSDGSTTITLSDLNPGGSLKDQTVTTVSADGLSKSVQIDSTGDGTFDQTQTDDTVVNSDGSKTETITNTSANGTVLSQSVKTTSADGGTKTTAIDSTVDGTVDLTQLSTIVLNSDGSTTITQQDENGDGSLRDETVTALSADELSKTGMRVTSIFRPRAFTVSGRAVAGPSRTRLASISIVNPGRHLRCGIAPAGEITRAVLTR